MDIRIFVPSQFPKPGFKKRKKPVGRPDKLSREDTGLMLEDYFANKLSIIKLSKKYNVSQWAIGNHISKMFSKRLDEDTEVRVFNSKV